MAASSNSTGKQEESSEGSAKGSSTSSRTRNLPRVLPPEQVLSTATIGVVIRILVCVF